jgi:hypothetical protein
MDKIFSFLLRMLALMLPFIRTNDRRSWIGGIILIASNTIPIIGVTVFNWQPSYILLLYWSESAIIGFFNIFKILLSGLFNQKSEFKGISSFLGVFLSGFFTVHYGGFMVGHIIFILVLFFPNGMNVDLITLAAGLFRDMGSMNGFTSAFIALFISHAYSFKAYFLKDKMYLDHEAADFMMRPYGRIVVMQITIILGAFILMVTGWHAGVVILWVVLKTIVDLRTLKHDTVPLKGRRPSAAAQR